MLVVPYEVSSFRGACVASHPAAIAVTQRLAHTMQLPVKDSVECPPVACIDVDALVKEQPVPDKEESVGGLMRIARAMHQQFERQGGILLHAGLIRHPTHGGVVLAGRGGVGKTTAVTRAPSPWEMWSDDAVLLMPNGGGYSAHPWPTWSRFYGTQEHGVWPLGQAVPLKAVYFLKQAPRDHCRPMDSSEVVAALLLSASQTMTSRDRDLFRNRLRQLLRLRIITDLAGKIPVAELHLTLESQYWDTVIGMIRLSADRYWVMRGSSMTPNLQDGDLLYLSDHENIRPGTIIGYREPGQGGRMIVHRVVATSNRGFLTIGDAWSAVDRESVLRDQVVGCVTNAWRHGKAIPVPPFPWRRLLRAAFALGRALVRNRLAPERIGLFG